MDVAALSSELSTKAVNISSNSTNHLILTSNCELDTHADTCTVGHNVLITHIHELNGIPKTVNVSAYDPTLGSAKDKVKLS